MIKRYYIKPEAIISSYTGDQIGEECAEDPDGEWIKYEDFIDLLYELRFFKKDLVQYYNLPNEYKYLMDKELEDMTEEEHKIYYKAIPAARLGKIEI